MKNKHKVRLNFIPINIAYVGDIDSYSALSDFHLKSEQRKEIISNLNDYAVIEIIGNIINDNDVDAIDFHVKVSSDDKKIKVWYASVINDSPAFHPAPAHGICEGNTVYLLIEKNVVERYDDNARL